MATVSSVEERGFRMAIPKPKQEEENTQVLSQPCSIGPGTETGHSLSDGNSVEWATKYQRTLRST